MLKNMRIMLCQKRLDDAVNDYTWKTDPELARLDACLPLDIPFNEYLYLYINELQITPAAKHEFSIETSNGEHIGNCAYFNVNRFKGEAEVGIMLETANTGERIRRRGNGITDRLYLQQAQFQEGLPKTLEGNTRAQNCFQNAVLPLRQESWTATALLLWNCCAKDGF